MGLRPAPDGGFIKAWDLFGDDAMWSPPTAADEPQEQVLHEVLGAQLAVRTCAWEKFADVSVAGPDDLPQRHTLIRAAEWRGVPTLRCNQYQTIAWLPVAELGNFRLLHPEYLAPLQNGNV